MPSSDNESLKNDSCDNKSVDCENGKGNFVQAMNEKRNMKQILKWDGNGKLILTLGQVSGLSLEKKCCSRIEKRMNFIISLNLCLSLRCGAIFPTKLTDMQKQGLHKDVSKNKYLLCYRLYYQQYQYLHFHFNFHFQMSELMSALKKKEKVKVVHLHSTARNTGTYLQNDLQLNFPETYFQYI